MNKIFYLLFFLLITAFVQAQTITPVIKANFGVEADLRANYFNNFPQSGNDDWFNMSAGAGAFVIDTTGAAGIISRYATDLSFRKLPFFRTMKYPAYSIVNNRLLLDAIFIRDYHGEDSTIFANGASKNGESPANWSCPVAQSVPDKNEILDMMVHIRRAGPNFSDSLWMFGGLSIENTQGDRYFDFEMYQTDIYYDRGPRKFYGSGPQAGHTAWVLDASGNVVVPGDIVFSASYGSSTLSSIEARIWVDRSTTLITPAGFIWAGTFDGASNGSQYGYAGIMPASAGIFYTGTESVNNTWAGPFSLVRGDNTLSTTYTAGQFMEFSVNLTKLGLDPVTLLGANQCGMPFRRILVKSRASTSFTSALKDFVGPFDFFLAPRADIQADQSVLCGVIGMSNISVTNPVSTSTYTWSTTNGHILGSTSGTSISVDSAGTYVVSQYLQSGCSVYATDTITVFWNASCFVLDNNLLRFNGKTDKKDIQLQWAVLDNSPVHYFEIEKSLDGIQFYSMGKIFPGQYNEGATTYSATDQKETAGSPNLYYRLKISGDAGKVTYSKTINFSLGEIQASGIKIVPNPVKDKINISIISQADSQADLNIYDLSGGVMKRMKTKVSKGNTNIPVIDCKYWKNGIYTVQVQVGGKMFTEKIVVVK